eukprot:TRINITY_DN12844_c0_g1_i17.p1 TRINITY_DN12844_c0_g1~~TRINITY_DN12844_c0_g1_i17.p1  ORF type:complete len:224 (+),score=59.90 TRINITY_DN12844_c0_g1_i17:25-672(+)
MIRRPPRSTPLYSSAASDVYKRQVSTQSTWDKNLIMKCYISRPVNFKRQIRLKSKNDLLKQNALIKNVIIFFKRHPLKEQSTHMQFEGVTKKQEAAEHSPLNCKATPVLLTKDQCNREIQLNEIERLNKLYSLRNKKFPYKSTSGERPKKLAKLVKPEEESVKSQRTRNLKRISKNPKQKNSNSLNRVSAKDLPNHSVVANSRNVIPDFKTPYSL